MRDLGCRLGDHRWGRVRGCIRFLMVLGLGTQNNLPRGFGPRALRVIARVVVDPPPVPPQAFADMHRRFVERRISVRRLRLALRSARSD